ncbi:MAG: ABC transporter substrate-binding protein [Methanoregulaceae archaeon]|nr:ABC transporter substrate-binding protein [Methanoregulaceae archaeon]
MKKSAILLLLVILIGIVILAGCIRQPADETGPANETSFRTVVDSRGIAVRVPRDIERVVTIDDGFSLEVMTVLGESDKLVGVGSRTYEEIDTYTYESVRGGNYTYTNGMNTMAYLHPRTRTLPVIAEFEGGVNYEALASLKPDVVIVRLGSCTFWVNDENVNKSLERMESLGIPVIVLYGTDFYEKPDLSTMWDEIRIIGDLFGKKEKANGLVTQLRGEIDTIQSRTENVSEKDKPSVLYLGLASVAREEGGAGNTVSLASYESWNLENIVNARNSFREESGYWHVVSAEQILAMNPDVIILPTDWGYHPVEEIYEAPYYRNLQELQAVQNQRVSSLPFTPYDCAKRLEYPVELMVIAKAAYPERFSDIDLNEWLLTFYQNLYGVDRQTAEGLRGIQWMDWVAEP